MKFTPEESGRDHRYWTRRSVLGLSGSSLLFSSFSGGASGTSVTDGDPYDKNPNGSAETPQNANTEYLSYPRTPFILGQFAGQYLSPVEIRGWEAVSLSDEIRTVLGLHLDVFDTAGLVSFQEGDIRPSSPTMAQLSFSQRTGLPATAGRNTSIELKRAEEGSIDPILEENSWTKPDGKPVESVYDCLGERFSGEEYIIDYTFGSNGIPSYFSPLGLHLMMIATRTRLRQGHTGFFVDIAIPDQIIDFSEWATEAFRDHLESLSTSRRSRLGIDSSAEFDIGEYLEKNGLTPSSNADPREDPVFREYLLHSHRGIKEYCAEYRSRVHRAFPDRSAADEIALWANQFTGDLYNQQAPNIYISDHFDVINTELFPTVNPPTEHAYKLLEAIGRFEKPVIAKGTLTEQQLPGDSPEFDPEEAYPMLQRFQVAESYAAGARLKIPLSPRNAFSTDESITQWIRADGTVDDELQSFIDFVWSHERFLANSTPDNDVAIVFSLPNAMYRRVPEWGIEQDYDRAIDSFIGTAKILRESQIPYSVLVFGHPELWEDSDQRERLNDYDAVVLPDIRTVTDAQRTALEQYVASGGSLISSGDPPSKTGSYAPRDDIATLFEKENAKIFPQDPGQQRSQGESAGGELVEELRELNVRSRTSTDDSTLAVNRRQQPDVPRTIIHLLNYDYSSESDSFSIKEGIDLRIPKPGHDVGIARYYSPQGTTDPELSTDGDTLHLTLPSLREWGFVVLAESEAELIDSEVEASAMEKTETARQRVAEARNAGRDWAPTFAVAETKLEAAETALEYDAYSQSKTAAEEAIEALEREPYRRPVVGIDLSHGQEASFDTSTPFEKLKTNLQYPDYRIWENWEGDRLEEIDVLVIPPALTYRGQYHGFTSSQVDRIESFVANGGSIVLLARGGVAPDFDKLTERFGYRFHGGGVKFPATAKKVAEVVTPQHELTRAVPEIRAEYATTIEEMPKDATELAAIPDNSKAWYHTTQPLDERNDGEESVPASPIYAVSAYEQGRVVALGNWSYLHNPDAHNNWMPVMDNLFSFLGRSAIEAQSQSDKTKKSETPTPKSIDSETQTETEASHQSEELPGETPKVNAPGFGIPSALAALGGAGYVLKLLFESDDQ